ncbi:MAG: Ig-like domain-containing protein [Myxococcota bacterium]|nr:Ig-like domain-containing protein [Myxococcota bacterium]
MYPNRRAFLPLLVLLLALGGCSDDFGDPRTLQDTGTARSLPACPITVDATWPTNDSIDHYYRDPVEFWLSDPDPTAAVVAPVPGTTAVHEDGHMLQFTPAETLEPDAPYTFDLEYCGGRPSLSFRTSPAGLPLADTDELVGKVWLIDLGAGRFTEGEPVGALLNGIFGRALLLGVVASDDGVLSIRGGISTDEFRSGPIEQDVCFRTVNLELPGSEMPDFRFEVQGFSFASYDAELTLANVSVVGTVHPEGTALDGVRWSVAVSGSELAELIPGVETAAAACEFASDLGVDCTACPDGSGEACIVIAADRMQARAVSTALVEITEADEADDCER